MEIVTLCTECDGGKEAEVMDGDNGEGESEGEAVMKPA